MKVYLDGDIIHYGNESYNITGVQNKIVKYFMEHYGEVVENKLKMKGKLIGLRSSSLLYDFGWYTITTEQPVSTVPKGVWTKHGNIYYNSFLLIQGRKEPCAKCLKCGKLVTGTFYDLHKHSAVCPRRELKDRVDHTWEYFGSLKYRSLQDLEDSKAIADERSKRRWKCSTKEKK